MFKAGRPAAIFSITALSLILISAAAGAEELSPEQCAAALQKSTVTVRIRLHPEQTKETTEEDANSKESTTQVTVCSGVAVDGKLIVTAAFAAADSQIRITMPGGEQTDAKLRVLDEFSGLALLEAEDGAFEKVPFAEGAPATGSWVMAAAAWGAEQPLVSVGIVGGVNRAIKGYVYPPLLQCDIQAAETSSGAPLIDRAGNLVGVIVAGDRPETQKGWLYAVPVSHVQRLLRARQEKAREDSVVVLKRRRPTCGLDLEPSDAGVLVSKVASGGPAEKAGIKKGDRIVSADGINVRYLYDARRPTLYKQPGDTMTFVVQRGDEQKKVELVLGGGIELPSASLRQLGELVAPKIDITRKAGATPDVTIREIPYTTPEKDQNTADKLRLLEKANESYRLVIEQQKRELTRRQGEQKEQAAALETLKEELENLRRAARSK